MAGVGLPIAADILSVSPITDRTAPAPTSNDMTGWLIDRLNENTNSPITQVLNENMTSGDPVKVTGATKAWTALVRTGATWDYKTDINKAGVKDKNDNVVLCGETLNYQAIANIHYGAMGRAAGISQWVLESGAGMFQIKDNWGTNGIGPLKTYFDDPYDNWMVNFGGWLYDNYKDQFGKLTPKQLEDAFKTYQKDHGSPGTPLG
jgi:hypothetical protein